MDSFISICAVIAITTAIAFFVVINAYLLYIHKKYAHLPSPSGAGFYTGHVSVIVAQIKQGSYVVETFKKWADECGPVYVFWKFYTPIVVVAHPEIIQELATQTKYPKPRFKPLEIIWNKQRFLGSSLFSIQHYHEWKDRRRMYDPFFTKNYLDNLTSQFNEVVSAQLVDHLRNVSDGKTEVDFEDVFIRVMLVLVNQVAFGLDLFSDEYITQLCGGLQGLKKLVIKSEEGAYIQIQYPFLPYVKPFGGKEYIDAVAKIREIGHYSIEKRIELLKHSEEIPQDMLTQIIAQSQKDDGSLKMEELIDDFAAFYIAGSDTPASALSLAFATLLQEPEILKRLQAEIDEVVGDSTVIDKDHLDKLELTQAILEESLRLHPSAPNFGKIAAYEISTKDYRIPKNSSILCSSYISHRDPNHFDDPLKFDPSRFEAGQKRPSPFVYMPFGIGHRSCIGRNFAMMGMKVILVHLLKNFEIFLSKSFELKKVHTFISKPANGIPCTLKIKN